MLKFFAFFDLEKLKEIFTALLLEKQILIVSNDLENLTACGLSLEHFIYPLEWLHPFVPIMPEHIDMHIFNQPFPFIYGTHTCIYEKLNKFELDNPVTLLVDKREVLNGDRDKLPLNLSDYLAKKLEYYRLFSSGENFKKKSQTATNLLSTGSMRPFIDCVLMIIDNYREYITYDLEKEDFRLNHIQYFKVKNVLTDKDLSNTTKYDSNNEFYHKFKQTQSFEEFCRDRGGYLKEETMYKMGNKFSFKKDFIDTIVEESLRENSKISKQIVYKKLPPFYLI